MATLVQSPTPTNRSPRLHRPHGRNLIPAHAVRDTAQPLPEVPLQQQASLQHAEQQTASVSRVLLTGQNPNIRLRAALSHKLTPITLAAAGVYTGSAIIGALRDWTITQSRSCKVCRGYSIQRCDLCGSAGSISWEGKWGHVEPCPKCVGKRYIRCTSCGGWHAHALFQHVSRNGPDMGEALQPVSADEQLRIVKRDLALD